MSEPIQTAIVGFGKSGKFLHAPFIDECSSFNLHTILERSPKDAALTYPSVNIERSYEDILKNSAIELIVIATPNDMHAIMVEQALLHGKHVVVDKPFTIHLSEAIHLQSLSHRMNKHIFVYQNRRWDGDFLTIQQLLKEEVLGEITSITSRFDRYRPEPRKYYWKESNALGNGLWYDLGSHLMDQAFNLFGEPSTYAAEIKTERTDTKGIDYFDVRFQFGAIDYTIHAGMLEKEATPRWIIKGSKGIYTKYGVDPQEAALNAGEIPRGKYWGMEKISAFGIIENNSGESQLYPTLPGNYRKFYEGVIQSLRNDTPSLISLTDAVNLVAWLEKLAQ